MCSVAARRSRASPKLACGLLEERRETGERTTRVLDLPYDRVDLSSDRVVGRLCSDGRGGRECENRLVRLGLARSRLHDGVLECGCHFGCGIHVTDLFCRYTGVVHDRKRHDVLRLSWSHVVVGDGSQCGLVGIAFWGLGRDKTGERTLRDHHELHARTEQRMDCGDAIVGRVGNRNDRLAGFEAEWDRAEPAALVVGDEERGLRIWLDLLIGNERELPLSRDDAS